MFQGTYWLKELYCKQIAAYLIIIERLVFLNKRLLSIIISIRTGFLGEISIAKSFLNYHQIGTLSDTGLY